MDPTTLVNLPNRELGSAAVTAVKAAKIPLRLAFWAYFVDAEEWRLVFITSWLDTHGPHATYTAVQKAFEKAGVTIPLSQTVLVRPGDPLATIGLNAVRATDPIARQGWNVRTLNVVINTDYIYNPATA